MRAGMAGWAADSDHSGRSSPDSTSMNGTAGSLGSKAGPSAASRHFSFRPAITARAAAKPARTPEELHAEAARRQEKLVRGGGRGRPGSTGGEDVAVFERVACTPVSDALPSFLWPLPAAWLANPSAGCLPTPLLAQAQRRREAEQAALAPCTFAPDIAPAAGSPLSAKFADKAKGRIDLQAGGGCVSLALLGWEQGAAGMLGSCPSAATSHGGGAVTLWVDGTPPLTRTHQINDAMIVLSPAPLQDLGGYMQEVRLQQAAREEAATAAARARQVRLACAQAGSAGLLHVNAIGTRRTVTGRRCIVTVQPDSPHMLA